MSNQEPSARDDRPDCWRIPSKWRTPIADEGSDDHVAYYECKPAQMGTGGNVRFYPSEIEVRDPRKQDDD